MYAKEEWIKMWYIYIIGYYSAIKKNEIMTFTATWKDLDIFISQTKIKYHILSVTCGT